MKWARNILLLSLLAFSLHLSAQESEHISLSAQIKQHTQNLRANLNQVNQKLLDLELLLSDQTILLNERMKLLEEKEILLAERQTIIDEQKKSIATLETSLAQVTATSTLLTSSLTLSKSLNKYCFYIIGGLSAIAITELVIITIAK